MHTCRAGTVRTSSLHRPCARRQQAPHTSCERRRRQCSLPEASERIRNVSCASNIPTTGADLEGAPAEASAIEKFADRLATLFPLWVFIGATLGIMRPQAVTWFSSTLFTYALGFLMLTMGLTLTVNDFKKCAERPAPILVGYAAQYFIKPLLGFLIAKALALPDALAVGLILVSCCPGGQASNVATFIAHGDVALSVLMTTASTIGAIVMTPLLTKLLAGAHLPRRGCALAY